MRLTQGTYILKMLENLGMQDCKPCKTPDAVHFKGDCFSTGGILSQKDAQRYQSHHWISDTRHDCNKTEYYVSLKRLLEVCVKAW